MNRKDLSGYANGLEFKNGIWFSKLKKEIYYPHEAHDEYFQLEEKSFWFIHRNNCIIEAVKNFPPGGFIFDIGGGNGFVSYGLEKCGIRTYLIEPGIEGIINAKKRELKNLICSSFEDAHFKENSLPAVGLFDVFEHIEDDVVFISKLRDVLVSGGRLYLTVPAFNILWSGEDDYANHFRRYTIKGIGNKLKSANFEIEYETYIFSFLLIPIFLFRSIPYRIFKKGTHSKEETQKQFLDQGRLKKKMLNKMFKIELLKIRNKKNIGFGSSCLLVAKKIA